MIVDAVLRVYEALTDGTNGINAIRSTVPRDVGVSAPAAVTVAHEYSSGAVARGEIEREAITDTPVVHVIPTDEVSASGLASAQHVGSDVQIIVRYAVRGAATHQLKRDCAQILRCAMRSLSVAFNDSTFSASTRNNIHFDAPRFRLLAQTEDAGDDVVIGNLIVTVRALDRWALGGAP
jgi:hypothetical protein